MQTLSIDPPIPFVLPSDLPVHAILVGCGGTGSHIAQSLARLASHLRDTGGRPLHLTFIDGDVVERKNVGRQLFCPAEIGQNKAQTLAARLSAALGLSIAAISEMATIDLLRRLRGRSDLTILVGAVDSATGRGAIADLLADHTPPIWLDCGNHEHSGQVAVGNTVNRELLRGCLSLGGICAALPSPHLVYPDLLKEAPVRPRADCAAAMEDNAQSLMVNQQIAAVAAQYLYQIVVRRQLTMFCTTVDLGGLVMRSLPITARAIAEAVGLAPGDLTEQPKKTTKKKARAA